MLLKPWSCQPVKIAIVSHLKFPIAQPFSGGLELHTHLLATRSARARGHQVTVFASRGSDPAIGDDRHLRSHGRLRRCCRERGLSHHHGAGRDGRLRSSCTTIRSTTFRSAPAATWLDPDGVGAPHAALRTLCLRECASAIRRCRSSPCLDRWRSNGARSCRVRGGGRQRHRPRRLPLPSQSPAEESLRVLERAGRSGEGPPSRHRRGPDRRACPCCSQARARLPRIGMARSHRGSEPG